MVEPPSNWGFIGNSPWTVLSNGHLLLGQKLTKRAAELDPTTLTWTGGLHFRQARYFRRGGLYPAAGRIRADGERDGSCRRVPIRNGSSPMPIRRCRSGWARGRRRTTCRPRIPTAH